MNGPSMLISTGASAAGTAANLSGDTAAADVPADEGFSTALASSIAGQSEPADAPDDEAPPQLAEAEDSASQANVIQWLGLPVATPPVPPESLGADESGEAPSADEVAQAALRPLSAGAGAGTAAGATAQRPAADARASDPENAATEDSTDMLPTDTAKAAIATADAMLSGTSKATTSTGTPALPAPGVSAAQAATSLSAALVRDGVAATNASGTAPTVHASLHESVGSTHWASELSSRLVMMSVRGQQEGSLTLTPEHLGPLEVQISVSKDTANVWFGAQHADTRAALAEAMPRLRELLAASGLSLGQSGVSEQTPRRSAPEAASPRVGLGPQDDGITGIEMSAPARRSLSRGLIDTYA